MTKSLFTKLQGKVDNNYIPKIGFLPISFKRKSTSSFSLGAFSVYGSNNPIAYLPDDGSYITDINGSQNLGTVLNKKESLYDILRVSKDATLFFLNKYDISYIDIYDSYITYEDIDLETFKYSNKLKYLSGHFKGSLYSLPSDAINSLEVLRIDNDSCLEDFNIDIFQKSSIKSIDVKTTKISGDLSKMPASFYELSCFNKAETLQYNGNRPSNSKVIALYSSVNLGSNLDAFLIDNAKFINNSKLSDYKWKVIEATGIRTSASDAAVQALNDFGLKVSVVQ